MTSTRTETAPLPGGGRLRLTVAEPDSVVRGGIVVLHEARGVTDFVRGLVSMLSDEGWLTVAPHLYHRDGADELEAGADEASVRRQVGRLTPQTLLADADAAFGWLAGHGVTQDRMGLVGFELGGSVALKLATRRSVGAAVSVSAVGIVEPVSTQLRSLVEVAPQLTCPWLGIYFGEADAPAEEVGKLRDAAAQADIATDVVRFDDPEDTSTDPDHHAATAVTHAWHRTLNWFDAHLR